MTQALEQIESSIRAGDFESAQTKILKAGSDATSREVRLKLAEFSRRAGIPVHGIKLLHPIVRPGVRSQFQSTALEKIEYSALLIRIGAEIEAMELLRSVDLNDHPEAGLFLGFSYIHQWEYEKAIAPLNTFIQHKAVLPYRKLVAQINLASAYIQTNRQQEAKTLLNELRESTKSSDAQLLYGNALSLSCENSIRSGNLSKAHRFISEAEGILIESGRSKSSMDALEVMKWRAILSIQENPKSERAHRQVQAVRDEAVSAKQWEIARECDLYLGLATENTNLLLTVYFGTPFEAIRRLIRESIGEPTRDFLYPSAGEIALDRKSGVIYELGNKKSVLKYEQLLHRLIKILTADLYRPQRLTTIHAFLFPERYYNPLTSPVVVHQAVLRLRRWLKKNRVPARITESGSYYQLSLGVKLQILYSTQDGESKLQFTCSQFKAAFKSSKFSAHEAAQLLKCSKRSAIDLLNQAVREGLIARLGGGKYTQYVSL